MNGVSSASELLIVGGAGFIGRHILRRLDEQGVSATIVVRELPHPDCQTQFRSDQRMVTLQALITNPDIWLADTKVVIYLASSSIPATFQDRPWLELAENVAPALEFFSRLASRNPKCRVVFASSGGTIYGPGHFEPITETSHPAPISAYGYGKLVIEEGLRFLARTTGLQYCILRVSNPVGPGQMNPQLGIVNVAIRAALKGEQVCLYDGGTQVRDYIDVDDVAKAFILASQVLDHTAVTWNIGSGVGIRVVDLLQRVEAITGLNIRTTVGPRRASDLEFAVLDSSRACRELAWSCEANIDSAIRRCHAFLKAE